MSPTSLAAETLRVAQEELARRVRETDGPNDSPEIRKYIRNLDPPLDFPIPWCAAFVQWCSDQASFYTGHANPLDDVVREAYVDDYYIWAQSVASSVRIRGRHEEAAPGDLALFSFGGVRFNHIGIVEEHDVDEGLVYTIEGNTSHPDALLDEERDGGGLYRKIRRDNRYRFTAIRWAA